MKPNYTDFDNALLDLIANGCNTMMALDSRGSGLWPIAEKLVDFSTPSGRVIDRRLQALRKKGAVRFNGKVWVRLGALGQPV